MIVDLPRLHHEGIVLRGKWHQSPCAKGRSVLSHPWRGHRGGVRTNGGWS